MLKFSSLILVLVVLGALPGYADGPIPPQARSISWAEFQQRCANPKANPNDQTPILNAVISCTDIRKEYVSAPPADIPLKGTRTISYDVLSEKFVVATASSDAPAEQQVGTCLRFKEVEKIYSFQRKVSCAEILNIKGDLANFCESSLNKGKSENPKSVAARDTGIVVDTCAGVDHVERAKPGKGDKGGKGNS